MKRVGLALAFALTGVVTWVMQPVPAMLLAPPAQQSLVLTDRHGLPLRTTRGEEGERVSWVALGDMDPDLPRAFITAEDQRFLSHPGVDFRAVARAVRDNLDRGQVVSGASTITMQLARLLLPIDRGYLGKLRQVAWALRLEAGLPKEEILEQYLNRVPLGQGAIGVSAAMRLYFNGGPEQASLGQAALLAGLARSPSSRNPLVSPGRASARRASVLDALVRQSYVTPTEAARASREPVLGVESGAAFLAPHFTTRLLATAEAEGRPLAGRWQTSLDLQLQGWLEEEVRHTTAQLADRGVRHGAVVVLDNRTGEVLAWVGSPDFWADTAGQVDMVVSPRQPGSAMKPFLYALAFDRGITAATVLADVATTYQTARGPYHPRNYDRREHGPVRAREALGSSYNIPAVDLAHRIGPSALLRGLHQAGFASLTRAPEHYGLGLALGNGDITLLELANGYRALANGGVWHPWHSLAVPSGSAPGEVRRVMSREAAVLTLDILADPDARAPAFGVRTPFEWPFPAAAKTGTSRHFTDNWAVGVTAGFTVAVWVGNFSGQPMEGVSGIAGAGPLLQRAMLLVARRRDPGNLVTPASVGLHRVTICRVSGKLAGPDCPTLVEHFVAGTRPQETCDWHRAGELVLPAAFAEWQVRESGVAHVRVSAHGDSIAEERPDRLTITSPGSGDHYRIPPGVDRRFASIALRATGTDAQVRWYVDGLATSAGRWPLQPGTHQVLAVAGRLRDSVTITVETP
ncbi:MAG: penicillin-binding protein 1C [Gemmatimonadota bacterium]|nr:penicillin-binding protein 1C [Gemmatimonadota bacterium]MDH5282506.1 penicillin-binding protein 1C [Gemmatimonadota bacterium]